MKKTVSIFISFTLLLFLANSFKPTDENVYTAYYFQKVNQFKKSQEALLKLIKEQPLSVGQSELILNQIKKNRLALKEIDFWLRYFEPIAYKKINGPLPVEWETEVFEKFEAPYKREGAGLTLAELYLETEEPKTDSLAALINTSVQSTDVFLADSITRNLKAYHHFFLANRLFVLNLAAVYTTGFECPDKTQIIPELLNMLEANAGLYYSYNQSFPNHKIPDEYINLYKELIAFVKSQSIDFTAFDHFTYIQKFVNPLYNLNHKLILEYNVRTNNFNDYSLNKYAASVFDKNLFRAQNGKGVYIGIDDEIQLSELKALGKLLFYDPVLSQNNERSCASCHKPTEYFTDTAVATSLQFNGKDVLSRNTPSLVNALHNHLLMLDGKHINLEDQTVDVLTNPIELGGNEKEIVKKVLSINEYKLLFKKYLKETPQYNAVNIDHITSALILYYSDFSYYTSAFDKAINDKTPVSTEIKNGFNLFMSKAQCGTCHFVPQFNGNKPPYIGSEFEVIGTPADTGSKKLSTDRGRFIINPAAEMDAAFRTATIRNIAFTKPYMHNGVFNTIEQVINFYNDGGGAGKGLHISNQTLSSDSLKLTIQEKKELIAFINSLNEDIPLQSPPSKLPDSKNKELNRRVVGGKY